MALDTETPAPPERPRLTRRRRERVAGRGGRWLAAFAVVMTLLAVGALKLPSWFPSLKNPFTEKTVDRSAPPVLKALEDLSEYRAASGHFEVIVDVEHDAKFLPSFIKGDRTLFVAVGTVEGIVDFSALSPSAVTMSDDRLSVSLVLPHASLGAVRVDPNGSYVFSRDRGALDRIGGMFADSPTSEQEFYQLAEVKMRTAAEGDASITSRAEENTRAMLTSMMKALGFTAVSITFSDQPVSGSAPVPSVSAS